jgi:[ribosomal protein S5]-alanine N-acetyltransferase
MKILDLPKFPILTTERLVLRSLTMVDLMQIYALRSNDSVNRFIDREIATVLKDSEDFIKKIEIQFERREGLYWAIALKTDNILIGTICFWNFNAEKEEAEVGFELLPGFQGQGIMLEAAKRVIQYGFKTMELKIISANTSSFNIKSMALLQKIGFKRIADFSEDKSLSGTTEDNIHFILTRDEYMNSAHVDQGS